MKTILSTLAIGFLIANVCVAAGYCDAPACCDQTHESCNGCGVQKTCKVVCEIKKVKKTCWVVKCEEFCASLPRCGCKSSCGSCGDTGCDSGGCGDSGCCGDPCASLKKPMVRPKCGKVRTRKKLVKKTITCEVMVYKCIVVCCNSGCNVSCGESDWEKSAPAAKSVSTKRMTHAAPLPPRMSKSRIPALRLDN